ncbi:extracellular solute-binding protein [Paenibacillus piri]|uniref:Extracellular solute-binding protein n=1 Tax=Paenibacillus piri TaxID=2547395 RepID=A0A4R5KUH8_9BACL|nr:extracellular solute-binding protein [Paenibacillus piri]TDF98705.1 extracellular solute-binding protein [Paenibacillus piri]
MHKQYPGKVLSILLTSAIALTACTSGGSTDLKQTAPGGAAMPATSGKEGWIVDKETELTVFMQEHPSFPVKSFADSAFLKYILDKTGIKLNIMSVPDGDAYKQKLNLILNSNDLPDIIWNSNNDANINSLGEKGAFLAYDDYLSKLPDIKNTLDQYPDIRKTIAANNNKLYIMPRILFDTMTELFIFRKDILEQEKLEAPKTFDELEKVLLTLKQKYPDKIPWINRSGSEHLMNRLANSWNTGYETATGGFYLNTTTKKYVYGPTEDGFKQMVVWLKKMFDEGLLDKEYALRTTPQWEQAFANEQPLFTIDFISRIQTLNDQYLGKKSNARVVAIAPPKGPTGASGIEGRSPVLANAGIAVSKSSKNPEAAFKFINWIYGAGRDIARYGIEGQTYTKNSDGTISVAAQMQSKSNPTGKDLIKDFGWVYYLNKFEFPLEHEKPLNPNDNKDENLYMYSRKVMEDAKGIVQWDPTLSFDDEQNKVLRSKGTAVTDYFKQNIDKFIMGARPIGEWDAFVKELQSRGLSDLDKVYNDAYQAYLKK